MRYIFTILLFVFKISVNAQSFYAFKDTANFLYTYDGNQIKKMEDRAIKTYKFGTQFVAFVTQMDELKVSFGSSSRVLYNNMPTDYQIKRGLMIYTFNNNLYKYDGKKNDLLCINPQKYILQDSLIYFQDRIGAPRVYCDGVTYNLDQLAERDSKIGTNIIAYNSYAGQFKVFMNGKLKRLENYTVDNYSVATNLVVYTDRNGQFKIVYKRRSITAELIAPLSYQIINDMVIYEINGITKVFKDGNISQIEPYAIDDFKLFQNSFLASYYSRNNEYKVITEKGNTIELTRNNPTNVSSFDNVLCYKDVYGHLIKYENQDTKDISKEVVSNFEVFANLVVYSTGNNEIVFVNNDGKIFRKRLNWQKF